MSGVTVCPTATALEGAGIPLVERCHDAGQLSGPAPAPDPDLLHRHRCAMTLVDNVRPEERVSLLAAVVWPSEAVLAAQAEANATEGGST